MNTITRRLQRLRASSASSGMRNLQVTLIESLANDTFWKRSLLLIKFLTLTQTTNNRSLLPDARPRTRRDRFTTESHDGSREHGARNFFPILQRDQNEAAANHSLKPPSVSAFHVNRCGFRCTWSRG